MKKDIANECKEKGQHCWNKGTGHTCIKCCFCGEMKIKTMKEEKNWEKEKSKFLNNLTFDEWWEAGKKENKRFIQELLKSEKAKDRQRFVEILEELRQKSHNGKDIYSDLVKEMKKIKK